MEKYSVVVCGGTFDHLHKGHREFLKFAFSHGKKVMIGLTTEKYAQNKRQDGIESYKKRRASLLDFLKEEKFLNRAKILPINDMFGPTLLKDYMIDTIIVSKKSVRGAERINIERKKLGLPKLKILVHPMILGEDQEPISSSKIREGKINRDGKVYLNPVWLSRDLVLTNPVKKVLKRPLGALLRNDFGKINPSYLITVGDFVTKYFIGKGLYPKISAIDFYIKREKKFSKLSELGFSGREKIVKVKNPPGRISSQLFKQVSKIFPLKGGERVIIQINGEEDLSVLPLIIAAPLGFSVFYGQPEKGMVKVEVSEENKNKIFNLVSQFTPRTRGY